MAGASVTMSHYLGGFSRRPSVQTDASGGYTLSFTATPWGMGTVRSAARAEIFTLDHDRYQRDVMATGPRLVENFRLHRITRIPAGRLDRPVCHSGQRGLPRLAVWPLWESKGDNVGSRQPDA